MEPLFFYMESFKSTGINIYISSFFLNFSSLFKGKDKYEYIYLLMSAKVHQKLR
jgi:hypothetical protein